MKYFCKTLVLGMVIGVMTMLPIGKAYSQSLPKPAVVISIAQFKEQMDSINYLLTASGFAQMKFMAKAMISGYTKGLDSEKAAGVLLYFTKDSEEPDFLAFVPVTDIEEMLDVIVGMAEVEEDDDFTTVITDQGLELLIKEQNGIAFISNNEEMFADLPDAPAELLGELPTKYNLAARVFGQRIPKELRTQILDLIKDSSEQTLGAIDSDVQAELQKQNMALQMKQVELVFNESDTLTLGMKADEDAKSLLMDIEFTAVPNSELAEKITGADSKKESRFTGFLMDGAAFNYHQNFAIDEEDAKNYSTMLDELQKTVVSEMDQDGDFSDSELATIESAFGNIVDAIKATLTEGIIDTGAVVMLEDGEMNIAAGAQVADPGKVEAALKELAAMAEEKLVDELEVNLNSGSHKDITFHQFVAQVPDDAEELRDSLGDQVTVVVGIGSKEVYFGAGSNPIKTLKNAIDGTEATKDLLQYNLYIAPILKFAAKAEGDPMVESMADAMEETGNDRIQMKLNLIKNGANMRFEMQDGILSLIKVGVEAFGQGNGGFPGGDDDF